MEKTELQTTREKVLEEFTAQQQLARIVCEVSGNLEDRAMQAMMEACLRKQT
jgi:hypothetical protein